MEEEPVSEPSQPLPNPSSTIHRAIYVCDRFRDLPSELQARIVEEGITETLADKHFEVLLHILHFKTKCTFFTNQGYEDRKANRHAVPKRRNDGPSLVHPEIVSSAPLEYEEAVLLSELPKKNYKLQLQVGKGGYGKIFSARSLADQQNIVAVKRLPHVGQRNMRKNFQEVRFLRYCTSHPNILRFVRASLYGEELWLVTEFIDGISLMEMVLNHDFNEAEIVYVLRSTLRGLSYLHENQIGHLDLKSGNVMVSRQGDVKIIDFGLSSDFSQGEVVHMVGSPFWMPPEMILHRPHGLAADIWSFGITAIELANGHPPHRRAPMMAMFTAATIGYPTPFKVGSRWSPLFLDFITRCLRKDPTKRWTASQLLKHEFLGKGKRCSTEQMKSLVAFILEQANQF